jgi:hypothetical protein
MPLMWTTRNSSGVRMPDSVTRPVSERFFTSKPLDPTFFAFRRLAKAVFSSLAESKN